MGMDYKPTSGSTANDEVSCTHTKSEVGQTKSMSVTDQVDALGGTGASSIDSGSTSGKSGSKVD